MRLEWPNDARFLTNMSWEGPVSRWQFTAIGGVLQGRGAKRLVEVGWGVGEAEWRFWLTVGLGRL